MAKFVPLKFWVTIAVYLALGLLPLLEAGILWISAKAPALAPLVADALTTRLLASLVSGLLALFLVAQGWRIVWKLPYVGHKLSEALFYDLNGTWTASLQSNYSVVEKMKDAANSTEIRFDVFDDSALPGLLERNFEVRIKQTWFRTDVEFLPNKIDPLLESKTICVEFFKAENGTKSMAWIFEAKNKRENGVRLAVTDEHTYQGAANLKLSDDGNELSGEFWQNRSWHRGLNAAGSIKLSRTSR
ncbi:hypothetical protein JI664_15785 [Rhodobacter sp. NTK016B]|uniref:hypothetical protein n=1 Tax=Rhodobacter sp. NTK016B TaxID=2759676 RepID=UPI001A8CFEAB|nr:hypothetical protein [Rhodobacter sp. NTK016B]